MKKMWSPEELDKKIDERTLELALVHKQVTNDDTSINITDLLPYKNELGLVTILIVPSDELFEDDFQIGLTDEGDFSYFLISGVYYTFRLDVTNNNIYASGVLYEGTYVNPVTAGSDLSNTKIISFGGYNIDIYVLKV